MKNRFVVSVHDVAPSTAEASRRWVEILDSLRIKSSLLVVPGRWRGRDLRSNPSFVAWLKEVSANGHEVVLHGWEHASASARSASTTSTTRDRFGRLMARGCQEFWNLDEDDARALIERGVETLFDVGFDVRGFVAPGWLMSEGTHRALRASGLMYTCDHTRLIDLTSYRARRMLTTSQRPNSVLSVPSAMVTSAIAGVHVRTGRSFRIALHPEDLGSARLRNSNIAACQRAVTNGFESNTYFQAWYSLFGRHSIRSERS
jgi:predicted deacetylase